MSTVAVAALPDVETYRFLEYRPGTWRREPFFIGRRLTPGQLVWHMLVNGLTPEEEAENYGLSLESVLEAMDYCRRHPDIVAADAAEERDRAEAAATIRGPAALSR